MSHPARAAATIDDLLAVPEHLFAEVVGGELQVSPRSRARHGRTQGRVSHVLGGPFDYDADGPGGWWFAVEPAVRMGSGEIACPDVCGWRRARVPTLPDELPIEEVPDWICEVLSPSTARTDRVRKADLYLAAGVRHYWLIDLDARILEALDAVDGGWRRQGAWSDGDRVRIGPFDAVEVDVGGFFGDPAA